MSERDLELVLNSMQRFILGLEDIIISYYKAMANAQTDFDKKFATTQMKLDLVKRQQFHAGIELFGNNFLLNEIVNDLEQHGLVTTYTIANVKSYLKRENVDKELKKLFYSDLHMLRKEHSNQDFTDFLNDNKEIFNHIDDTFDMKSISSIFNNNNTIKDNLKDYLIEQTSKSNLDKEKLTEVNKINILKDMEDGQIDQITPEMKETLKNHFLTFGYEKNSWLNTPFINETKNILNNSGLHGHESKKTLRVGMFKANLKVNDLDELFTYKQSLGSQFSYSDRILTRWKEKVLNRKKNLKTSEENNIPNMPTEEGVETNQEEQAESEFSESEVQETKEVSDEVRREIQELFKDVLNEEPTQTALTEESIETIAIEDVEYASANLETTIGEPSYPHETIGSFFFETDSSPVIMDIMGSIDEALEGTNPNDKLYNKKIKEHLQMLIEQDRTTELEEIIRAKPEAVLFLDEIEFKHEGQEHYLQKHGAESLYSEENALQNNDSIEIENRNRAYQIQKAFELEHARMDYKAHLKKKAEQEYEADLNRIAELEANSFGGKSITELPTTFSAYGLHYAVESGLIQESDVHNLFVQLEDEGLSEGSDFKQRYIALKKNKEKDLENNFELNMFKK